MIPAPPNLAARYKHDNPKHWTYAIANASGLCDECKCGPREPVGDAEWDRLRGEFPF